MSIPIFSNAQQALDWIDNNPGLSVSDLKGIFDQFKSGMASDPTITNAQAGLFYSGAVMNPVAGSVTDPDLRKPIYSGAIAQQLAQGSGGDIAIIDNTQMAQLLGIAEPGKPFFDALSSALGGDAGAYAMLFGSSAPGGVPVGESFWGQASASFGEALGDRPVGLIGAEYNPDRVFGGVELPGYINDPNPRGPLLGLPQSTWQGLYGDLKAQHGEAGAMSALHDLVKAGANAQQANLDIGQNPDGSLSFAAKPGFIPIDDFAGTKLPDTSKPIGNLWWLLSGDDYHGGAPIGVGDIPAISGYGQLVGKIPGLLDKMGSAGDLLRLGLAIGAAAALLDNGDILGALEVMGEWALDLAGGTAGSVASIMAFAPLLALLPAGIATSGLALMVGLAGGFAGSKLALAIGDAALSYGKDYISPIVIDLKDDGFHMSTLEDGVWFDIDNDGFAEKTAFPINGDAILVRDLNGNGLVDNQNEMFGDNVSQVIVPNGTNALSKLQALDTNHDNIINKFDTGFAALKLWIDTNHNGISEPNEMFSLAQMGVGGFRLSITPSNGYNYDINGSTLVWHADWLKTNGAVGGQYGDINFAVQQVNSWHVSDKLGTIPVIKPETLDMPVSRGYGVLKSLPIAASENTTLYNKLKLFDAMTLASMGTANSTVTDLMYQWAGVSGVTAESGTIYYNARMIAFMEKFFGQDFKVTAGDGAGGDYPILEKATFQLSDAFAGVWQTIKSQLMVQGPLKGIYANSYYDALSGEIVLNDSYENILARAKAMKPVSGISSTQYWQEVGLPLIVDARNHGLDPDHVIGMIHAVAGINITFVEGYFMGQNRDENYRASVFNDYMDGGNGNDTLQGMEGDDVILGMAGADLLEGSEGNDTVNGGTGNDIVTGDHIYAIGDDVVYGGDGADTLYGGQGNDYLSGDAGTDAVYGGMGSDTIEGDTNSADYIFGGTGDNDSDWIVYRKATTGIKINLQSLDDATGLGVGGDTLSHIENIEGTKYADSIVGNGLSNYLYGGAGNDTLDGGHVGEDYLDGGTGFDFVVFHDARLIRGIEFWLGSKFQSDILIHGQTRNIEGVIGSDFADTIFGDAVANILMGKAGNDYIFGGVGNDTIMPGWGLDTIGGDAGIDQVNYSDLTSGVTMTLVPDPIAPPLFDRIEQIMGSNYNDVLQGHTGAETIWGANGRDHLDGQSGHDLIDGGAGNDTLFGGTGNDILIGGTGADHFDFRNANSGKDTINDFVYAQGDRVMLATGTAYQVTDLGLNVALGFGTNTITLIGIDTFNSGMVMFG